MKDHALIKLLKSFSRQELKELGEFISNSYFNKRKAVRKLFEIIKKYYPEFSSKEFEKEKIFSKLFPAKQYNENSIGVLIYCLHDLAKKFVAQKRYESNKLEYNFNLEYELFKRKQFSNPVRSLEKHLNELDPSDYLSEQYYNLKFRLKYETVFYLFESNSGVYETFLDKIDFQDMFTDFHYHYLIKSMRIYLNVLNTENIYNKKYEKRRFEKLLDGIDVDEYNDAPVLQIYYYLIRMLMDNNNEKFYFKVKNILKNITTSINFEDLIEMHINMQNFCRRKLSEGKQNYKREEFEILRWQLDAKTYTVNDSMAFIFYRNAVNTALKLNELNWAKEFIENFKNDLQEEFRESTYLFSSAQYEFAMKNYDLSLEKLSKIKFNEVYLKYEAKVLQMLIYYETDSYEALISSLEAYRHFLQNNKLLSGNKKKLYQNFYKYFIKLVNSKKRNDNAALIKIKNEILNETTINNKDWLLKKIDAILLSGKEERKLRRA